MKSDYEYPLDNIEFADRLGIAREIVHVCTRTIIDDHESQLLFEDLRDLVNNPSIDWVKTEEKILTIRK